MTVSTLAGSGSNSFADGPAASARFNTPSGVAVDSVGNVYVADYFNNRIRKIDTGTMTVSTLAGSGVQGSANGPAASAEFYYPAGVAIDSVGNMYVADSNNHGIRKIDTALNVSTLAGSGAAGSADGPAALAQFSSPQDVAVDSAGNVYVADCNNTKIRKIDVGTMTVSTLAGRNAPGFADGAALSAQFRYIFGVAVNPLGNVYVTDTNHRIRKIYVP
jgi:streptogramin lyase